MAQRRQRKRRATKTNPAVATTVGGALLGANSLIVAAVFLGPLGALVAVGGALTAGVAAWAIKRRKKRQRQSFMSGLLPKTTTRRDSAPAVRRERRRGQRIVGL